MKQIKKKIIIVGGGITGCVSALYAAQKNFDVSLIEKGKFLGGILRDAEFGNKIFFNACQYFNTYENWYKNLIKNNFKIKTFLHLKGTYSDFFKNNYFLDDIAGPFLKKKISFNLSKKKSLKKQSLFERFSCYPQEVKNELLKWLNNFNIEPKRLSWDSGTGLAINRIFPRFNIQHFKKIKKRSKFWDELLGLKRTEMDFNDIEAALPEKGFNFFFDEFYKILKNNNVNIFLSTAAVPIWNNNELSIKFNNNIVFPEKVIWTGNPTGLIKKSGFPFLDSLHISAKHFFYEFEGELKNNIYTQIYSLKSNVFRIFFYKLKKKNKISIETLSDKISSLEVKKVLNNIIKKMKLKIKLKKYEYIQLQKKYIFISNRDNKIIKTFITKTKESNLIHGNWLNYGRDKKVNHVLNEIDKI